jgi:two-component system nitrogen regulation response regulator NtrX
VDVRVLAATNKDLELEVKEGRFREDLYFRLNVVPLESPPLRERKTDVPLLAKGFLRDFCAENGARCKPIDDAVLEALAERPWPGNVRELRNVVERMAILSGDRITLNDLPAEGVLSQGVRDSAAPSDFPRALDESGKRLTLREYRGRAEKEYILQTLDQVGWNISRAATILGVERTNLHKKMRSYGIRRAEV